MMKHTHRILLSSLLLMGVVSATQATEAIGWIEHVRLQPQNLLLQAKIDTGADNASIHAEHVQVIEHNGTRMVKFSITNKNGESANYELPLVRYTSIKRKGAAPLQRPVVNMKLCLGHTLRSVNINLANRKNFKYRVLIGRSYLKDLYLVDSSKQYTAEPHCQGNNIASAEY